MAKVRMNDYIEYQNQITTINELDARGLIEFKKEITQSKRTKTGERWVYYAWLRGSTNGWEIGAKAYESRINKQNEREKLWNKLDNKNDYNYMLTVDQKGRYFFIDNTKEIELFYTIYTEYEKSELEEWGIIDNDNNVIGILNDIAIDFYSIISCGSFFNNLTILKVE